jgi:protein TonB
VVPIIVTNAFPRVRSLGNEVAVANPQLALPVGSTNSLDYNLPLGNPNSSNIGGPRRPVNISHLSEGAIIRRVLPTYPPLAKLARIEGAVVLEAVISRSGRVENLRVISGRPILAGAATDAVSQWQFRPYILNGAPVEVLTQITVEFKLNRGD